MRRQRREQPVPRVSFWKLERYIETMTCFISTFMALLKKAREEMTREWLACVFHSSLLFYVVAILTLRGPKQTPRLIAG